MQAIQVDFYLLSEDSRDALLLLACRLLEKAYFQKITTWVWCKNETDAAALDSKLWTFKEESFVPHARDHEKLPERPLIEIATHYPKTCTSKLLVNLSSEIVLPSPHLTRILEIVPYLEEQKAKSRENYRLYRQAQYKINTHQISV